MLQFQLQVEYPENSFVVVVPITVTGFNSRGIYMNNSSLDLGRFCINLATISLPMIIVAACPQKIAKSLVRSFQGGPASVRFGSYKGRFERFRFSVPTGPLWKGLFLLQCYFNGFGSWKTVPTVPVPLSVPRETVPAVLVSGSGSVPGPSCHLIAPGGHAQDGLALFERVCLHCQTSCKNEAPHEEPPAANNFGAPTGPT